MRKFFKKGISLVLAASMLTFGLAACGSKEDTTENTPKTEQSTEKTEEKTDDAQTTDTAIDTSKHEVIKMVALGNKPANGRLEAMLEQLNKILTEKVNAELEFQFVEWADWQTQYNLLLASGDDTIDLITAGTDWLDSWPNAKKGSFLPLTEEMLTTYAPQTYATVSAEEWADCSLDGTIYIIPENNFTQYVNHGFYYRGDWAQEFGLSDIKSFEDFGKYLQGVKDTKTDVIPWDVAGTAGAGNILADGFIQSNTQNIRIEGISVGSSAIFFGNSKDDPYTVGSPYMDGTTFEDFAKMMKTWADNGYWREDVLNFDGDAREAFYSGMSGADQHHTNTYIGGVATTMMDRQPGGSAKMFPFSEPSKNLVKTSISHGALAIGASSKHPERALMVYDLLRNDEQCYRLINYGIEGSDYIITAEGKLDRPEGYDPAVDALGSNYWCGRNDALELTSVEWYEGKDAIYADYDSYAIAYPYSKFIFDQTPVATQIAAMADVCANYIPRIAFGKVEDPTAIVAEFREQMKSAGYDEVLQEVQKQLNAAVGK